ncbi:CBM_collapsed_G0000920.mRNA.1.CDS.1 [Saccharomyces cerevisiae]|nr:CBM_collapsed_G0000920.mRNA.1.CDS.1 [Saccharomyces cerevisiae]
MVGSSTASLEISTYAGSANSLLAGSGLVLIINEENAFLLLAINETIARFCFNNYCHFQQY